MKTKKKKPLALLPYYACRYNYKGYFWFLTVTSCTKLNAERNYFLIKYNKLFDLNR